MKIGEGWQVVLIDDEADIREIMTIALEDAGYQVATAKDGEAGIRLTEEILPQIIITDIRMPGMNGIEVLRKIKEINRDTDIIMLSAHGDSDTIRGTLNMGANYFLGKPIEIERLLNILEVLQ